MGFFLGQPRHQKIKSRSVIWLRELKIGNEKKKRKAEIKWIFLEPENARKFYFIIIFCVRGGGLRNLKNRARVVAISLYNNPEQYFFIIINFCFPFKEK